MIDVEFFTEQGRIVDIEKDEPFVFLLCNNSIVMCSYSAEKQHSPLETCSTLRPGRLLDKPDLELLS